MSNTIVIYVVADSKDGIDLREGANRSPVFFEYDDAIEAADYQNSNVYILTAEVTSI
jgi:hypothetical protein